jgi:hypothetical protein
MRMPAAVRLLATAAALAAPVAAHAQFTIYTDFAAFLSATSGAATDTFDDLAPGVTSPTLARTAGALGYTVTVNTTQLFVAGTAGDRWLSANTATDVMTFGGFAPSVRGVGGFFFGTDAAGAFRSGTDVVLRATSAAGTVTRTLAATTPRTFVGFVSASPITAVSVEAVIPAGALAWPAVNDVVLASAGPTSVVPEPTTLALVALGSIVLVLGQVRRRA